MTTYIDTDDSYASSSKLTFPTSSIRGEPSGQSSSTTPRHDPLNRLVPDPPRYQFDPQYAHYVKPHSYKIANGLQSNGTLTTDHPLVSHYLKQLKWVSPEAGRTENEKWWTKGIRQPDVNEVLDLPDIGLDEYQSDCVFALAALRVLQNARHPKHFALWGKEVAQRTAERVHRVLQLKPCPIAYSYGWLSVSQSLWVVDAAQAAAFPAGKAGTEIGGRNLRTRPQTALTSSADAFRITQPPKKRARTARNSGKGKAKARQDESVPVITFVEDGPLSELPLPVLSVAADQGQEYASIPSTSPASKATKLELMGVDAPLTSSIIVDSSSTAVSRPSGASDNTQSPPEPMRRSARQATRRPATSSSSANIDTMSPTSDITALDSPSVSPVPLTAELADPVAARPLVGRARSSSSSCGSTSTVVSEAGSSSAETAVEPEGESESVPKIGSKRKRGIERSVEEEKAVAVRASTRVRKPAAKKVEAAATAEANDVVDSQGLAANKIPAVTATSPAKKRTRQRTNSRRG